MSDVTASERPPPRRRRAAAILAGAAVGALLAGAAALAAWPRAPAPLPRLGAVAGFELTSHEGRPVRLDDLRGQVFAATFVFTRCQTICPVIVGKLRKLQAETAELGPAFRLVSFSVDPEHDTPQVLAAYAREQGADPRRWVFLTGAYDALRRTVVDGFKQVMERGPDRSAESILHGSHVVLVDGAGAIRGYYDAADADCVERVARDARALVERADWELPRVVAAGR
jgi:protein SCO1/2